VLRVEVFADKRWSSTNRDTSRRATSRARRCRPRRIRRNSRRP